MQEFLNNVFFHSVLDLRAVVGRRGILPFSSSTHFIRSESEVESSSTLFDRFSGVNLLVYFLVDRSWWAGRDSNPRRQSQQIYSLPRLTASVPTQICSRSYERVAKWHADSNTFMDRLRYICRREGSGGSILFPTAGTTNDVGEAWYAYRGSFLVSV